MKVVELHPRWFLHPAMFGLSSAAHICLLELICWLADHPEMEWVPVRVISYRAAKDLLGRALISQDGAVFRLDYLESGWAEAHGYPESGLDGMFLPRIADGLGSKALVLAPKPESSKALVLEATTVGLFERFWTAFDLKSGRKEALEAFKKAIKRADAEVIIERAGATAEWFRDHPDPPKRKYAQGWLNRDRWEDELAPYPNPNGRPRDAAMDTLARAQELREEGQ